jgi:hypothetical protein
VFLPWIGLRPQSSYLWPCVQLVPQAHATMPSLLDATGLINFLSGLASNQNLLHLCLHSNCVYRHEPTRIAFQVMLKKEIQQSKLHPRSQERSVSSEIQRQVV